MGYGHAVTNARTAEGFAFNEHPDQFFLVSDLSRAFEQRGEFADHSPFVGCPYLLENQIALQQVLDVGHGNLPTRPALSIQYCRPCVCKSRSRTRWRHLRI